jgi:hypothetical protein
MADTAVLDVVAHTGNSLRELVDSLFRLTEQMQNQSQSGLPPYSRQFGKLAHCLFKQLRGIGLSHLYILTPSVAMGRCSVS